jgi:glycosyltransferase involved in cell wall biosynthesis
MKQSFYVLQIIDSMGFGGAEVLLRDLTRSLLAHGQRVGVCYNTDGAIAAEIKDMGVTVTRFPHFGRVDPILVFRLFRWIKQMKPDIVHTHLFKSDFHGRLAAHLAGTPLIISTLHNCHNWARNPILGNIYGANARLADHIIAVSDEVREYAIKYLHIDPQKVTTIANAVPLDRFGDNRAAGRKVRQEFNIPPSTALIGIVARLTEQKDHENFLHAAQKILIQSPDTRFLIVGDGPLGDSLKALSVNLGMQNSVIFSGLRQDIPAVMGALDMLVFSSRWEGLPVALLEGMASFLPVVSTNVGGVPGVLQDGVMGLLVPPADAEALASACLSLIKDPELRNRMGQAGSTHVQSHYGMDGMVNKTISMYQTLLQN